MLTSGWIADIFGYMPLATTTTNDHAKGTLAPAGGIPQGLGCSSRGREGATMNTNTAITNHSRFVLRVAAAITGDDPWAQGSWIYRGTYRTLTADLPAIRRDHGGNTVEVWYWHEKEIRPHQIEEALEAWRARGGGA